MGDLQGKACIVTGGGRGIGRAVALRLARAGGDVLIAARSRDELEETVRLASQEPGRCISVDTDLTRVEATDALVAETIDRFSRIDVLVNNAGVAYVAGIDKMQPEQFESMLSLNVRTVFYLCRTVWPHMVRQRSGTIVNISSRAALDPLVGLGMYGATKAWMNLFTRELAKLGRPAGIRAFAIGPGAVETPMLRNAFPDFPREKCLEPDDVASTIEALLEDRCKYVNGQTVYVVKE